MNQTAEASDIRERLAFLWNQRISLNKVEWVEFYDLLIREVWGRVNIRSMCDALLIDPREARHDCFVQKILSPARGARKTCGKTIEADGIIKYLANVLRNYLHDQLRRQDVNRGSHSAVINLTADEWSGLVADQVLGADETSSPLLTSDFERRLKIDVLPSAALYP